MFFFHYTPVRGISVSFFSIFFGAPPLSSAPALLALRPLRCFWRSATAGAMRPMPPPARPSVSTPSSPPPALYPYISCKKTAKGSGSLTKNIHYFTYKPYNLIFMVFFSHYGGENSLPCKRDTSFFAFFCCHMYGLYAANHHHIRFIL